MKKVFHLTQTGDAFLGEWLDDEGNEVSLCRPGLNRVWVVPPSAKELWFTVTKHAQPDTVEVKITRYDDSKHLSDSVRVRNPDSGRKVLAGISSSVDRAILLLFNASVLPARKFYVKLQYA